jgi:hypothetical protein
MKKYFLVGLFIIIIFLPLFSQAAGLVPCGNEGEPVCNLCFLIKGIDDLVDWGLGILIIVALLAIFVSGIMYIVSIGDNQMMETSKNFMKSAVIGVVVFLCAWLVVNITMNILGVNINSITGYGNWWNFDIICDVPYSI